ncbi:ubiquitin carboxyl-terminal hydrolase 27 isoform X2 [Vigna radiata var. radiata]|uniref:ubiquitinyl hydrolase 1 n=1 Tax=Vigna radiata var. radiata TaxID=3916 RepID=A0A1S3UZW1_VIGRR|nr:ubiquitin carboxyl-terminal hydrolase 27 isoform X2 [Vigna radiata var. radiata]
MRFNECPMNWIGVTVGGVVGVVGAILTLKDGKVGIPLTFATHNSSSDKPLFVPGLQNLQNNCFLNVVLQALASCFYFQGFLHVVMGECGNKDLDENMPLSLSLATLLEELSSVSGEKVTLSPRKTMLAMSNYIPNFSLTSQQRDCQSEQDRWQQHFLGPFDGILASSLTCQSCSSQISINLEHFDCLPLSPVLSDSSNIRFGCTLVDCLKQFIVAEHVENYRCSYCWHNAAIKYLSVMEGNEVELEKLRRCSEPEICDCRKMYNLDKLPWSNRFSHTLKQLSIARCPRILCIQLKRVSMNAFGELVKLQGHISFPLILDVLSFVTTWLGVKTQDIDVQSLSLNLKYNRRNILPNHSDMQSKIRTLKFSGLYEARREQINSYALDDRFISSTNGLELHSDTVLPCSGTSESTHSDAYMQSNDKADASCDSVSQETCLYQLVSVVEHFGKAGSGHYTVYRSVRGKSSEDELNQTPMHWFCISDSQVRAVSVEDVLSSEASLLFYERIPRN